MPLIPIHRCVFETVPADELPDGKACHIIENPGEIIIRYAEGHLKPLLRDQLNTFHARFFETNMWLQNWDPENTDRLHPSEDVPHGVAKARYVFVTEDALPEGMLCYPVEGVREFIWLIVHFGPEGEEMTEQGRQEMNDYLEVVIGRGLFVQQRPQADQ